MTPASPTPPAATPPAGTRPARIAAPLWVEWAALRGARAPVVHTGLGPRRSARAARRLGPQPLLVAGVGVGLAPEVNVGHVVVASMVLAPDGTVTDCAATPVLVDGLRAAGLMVHCGPVVSTPRLVDDRSRSQLAATGALAADMESGWLAPARPASGVAVPFAVVRAISDLGRPLPGLLWGGLLALRALHQSVRTLDRWTHLVTQPGGV